MATPTVTTTLKGTPATKPSPKKNQKSESGKAAAIATA